MSLIKTVEESSTVQLRWFFTDPPKPVGHKIEWGGLKFNDHR